MSMPVNIHGCSETSAGLRKHCLAEGRMACLHGLKLYGSLQQDGITLKASAQTAVVPCAHVTVVERRKDYFFPRVPQSNTGRTQDTVLEI